MRKLLFAVLLLLYACTSFAGDPVPRNWNASGELTKLLESRELVFASEAFEGLRSDAVVMLGYFKRHQNQTTTSGPRVAFAIGDGTLLVTAAHCIADFDNEESQAVSREIVVISPYYGDIFGFEIAAVDKDADLAILKVHWNGHPALELADEEELAKAKKLITVGYPPPFIANSNNDVAGIDMPFKLSRTVNSEELPLKRLTDKGPEHAIALIGTRYIGPGWSGSAMVLPNTGKVAGVVCNLSPIRGSKTLKIFGIPIFSKKNIMVARNASGCSVSSIRNLIKKDGLQEAAYSTPAQYDSIKDSAVAFSTIIEYIEGYLFSDMDMALAAGKKLTALRPESTKSQLFLAEVAQNSYTKDSTRKELLPLVEESYQKALRLDPNSAVGHAGFASFLKTEGRYDQGLAETEKALAIDKNNQLALVTRMGLLLKDDPSQAEELAARLTSTYPKVAHYWYTYSSILRSLDKFQESLKAAQKAVELQPDGLFSGEPACAYEGLRQYDEAEKYYEKMSIDCGCQHCLWEYSRFLVRHRPEKLQQAQKALDAAEAIKGRRVSQENLNYTRLMLLEKKSAKEAEVFCNKLLDENPHNKDYWYAMAGILRTLKKHNKAVEAVRKAIALCPECEFNARLASTLSKAGELKEAEKVYEKMLEKHPERQKYWFWYARFLSDYYPERKEEVRDVISQALINDKKWQAPQKELEYLCSQHSVKFK
ncbi:MAG: tetratricopeptide repeat protein [Phycisphaerae bacterium]|nr:tetratricopeptide repeat protein [Phycisphaerae bacterium]